MAALWLLRERRLDSVSTRDAAISRLLPDVLAILPQAWPQPAARDASDAAASVTLNSGTGSQDTGGNSGLSEDLAAACGEAAGVCS